MSADLVVFDPCEDEDENTDSNNLGGIGGSGLQLLCFLIPFEGDGAGLYWRDAAGAPAVGLHQLHGRKVSAAYEWLREAEMVLAGYRPAVLMLPIKVTIEDLDGLEQWLQRITTALEKVPDYYIIKVL